MNAFPLRQRGILAARADSSEVGRVLNELNSTFAGFRSRNDSRLEAIEATVNAHAESMAALVMGGGQSIHAAAGIRGTGAGFAPLTGAIADDLRNTLRTGQPMAAMSTQSNPDGGYTVVPELDTVLDTVLRSNSPLRGLARVVNQTPGTGDWKKVIALTGSQSAWVGEEDDRADLNNGKFGEISIPAREIYAMPQLTNNLLEDSSFDLNAFMAEDVAGEFALTESAAFISGTGVKQPSGFLSRPVATTADATRAFGTLQYTATGAASAFATSNPADVLHDLMTSLRAPYRAGPGVAWLMNSATANVIRKFKDGQGNYLWTNAIAAGTPDRLLGYPVAIDESMPDIGAGAFPVAFGNWQRGYAIVDKPGIRLIVDRLTKKGWTKMFFYKRVGGGVVDSNAIKLLKVAAS